MKEAQIMTKRVDFALNIHSVEVRGFIDATTAPLLEETVRELRDGEVIRIIVDLEGVDHISSSGWRVIFAATGAVREQGGDLKVAGMSPEVESIFRVLEFDRILFVYPSVEAALDDFRVYSGGRESPRGPRGETRDLLEV